MLSKLKWWIIPVVALIVDQITKFIAVSSLDLYKPVQIIGEWLRFTLVYNTKGAFSVYLGHQWLHTGLMSIGTVFVTVYFFLSLKKNAPNVYLACIGLITGGAYGNLVDRVRMSKVVDFIEMGIPGDPGYYWPVYNVADSFVVIGVTVLLIYSLIFEKNDKKENTVEN